MKLIKRKETPIPSARIDYEGPHLGMLAMVYFANFVVGYPFFLRKQKQDK